MSITPTATLANGESTGWLEMPGGQSLGASCQGEGNYGNGTLTVEVSNDKVNARALKLLDGSAAPTLTADGYIEISTGAKFVRATLSGGTGGSVDVFFNGAG